MKGKVVEVCKSESKGVRKMPCERVELVVGSGLMGDAHAGPWHRQVSLLACESIKKMKELGLNVGPGDFAENITTQGIVLPELPIGTKLSIGRAVLSVTQIGKECHTRCAIFHQAGDCVMPREGIFAEVLRGGIIEAGQVITVWAPFRARIITLSDRCYRGETVDESGPALAQELSLLGADVQVVILPDEADQIEDALRTICDAQDVALVLTTGGTGLSPRDVTPEATLQVVERLVPGIAEAIRFQNFAKTPNAMLSRAVAGIRGRTLIVNLPGSVRGALESFAVLSEVLPHALETLRGATMDCGR